MNGRRAKALRKEIYGENSIREKPRYHRANGGYGTFVRVGLRRKYQDAKKKMKGRA